MEELNNTESHPIKHSETQKKLKYDFALLSLLTIVAFANMSYALIAPFLPFELVKQ